MSGLMGAVVRVCGVAVGSAKVIQRRHTTRKRTRQRTSQRTSHGTSQLEFTTRNANCTSHVQPDLMTPTGGMSSALAPRAAGCLSKGPMRKSLKGDNSVIAGCGTAEEESRRAGSQGGEVRVEEPSAEPLPEIAKYRATAAAEVALTVVESVGGCEVRHQGVEVPEFVFQDRIQQRAFEQLDGFSEVVEKSVFKVPFLGCQGRVKKTTVEQFADIPEEVEEHLLERSVRTRIAEQIVDTPALPGVEKVVFIACRHGAGERLSSSVACPRGAGRRLRRRIACRRGAGRGRSTCVTCRRGVGVPASSSVACRPKWQSPQRSFV